jgi:prevent-host-death family protein
MDDHVYNIAEAKMHLSKLIDRVEHGERITIARNNRPVAIVSPASVSPADVLARIDAIRERLAEGRGPNPVLEAGQSLRELVDAGRHLA